MSFHYVWIFQKITENQDNFGINENKKEKRKKIYFMKEKRKENIYIVKPLKLERTHDKMPAMGFGFFTVSTLQVDHGSGHVKGIVLSHWRKREQANSA